MASLGSADRRAFALKINRYKCPNGSYTPIFQVMKADKSKYRLVYDLRTINNIVQDQPVEVPDPHTLLMKVPPEVFTEIDLCFAFFSVPQAEDSQYFFAFTYRGKQYTYTRAYNDDEKVVPVTLLIILTSEVHSVNCFWGK